MAENKTQRNNASVLDFLNAVENPKRKIDALKVNELMQEVTGEKPEMWGASIVGYGSCHLKYDSGREMNWMLTGFSPRKTALTLYIMPGFEKYDDYLSDLGKFKIGKSCLYIKKLEDVNMNVLSALIADSVTYMRKKHG